MLYQIHWQLRSDPSQHEMVAQSSHEECGIKGNDELREWCKGVMDRHPLPSDQHIYMLCTEESKDFTWSC